MTGLRRLASRGLLSCAFAALAPTSGALAQTTQDCTAGSVILTVNGVLTSGTDALKNLAGLKSAVNKTQTPDGKPIVYDLFLNWNNGARDAGESVAQKITEWARNVPGASFLLGWEQRLVAAIFNGTLGIFYQIVDRVFPGRFTAALKNSFEDTVISALGPFAVPVNNAVLPENLRQKMETYIDQGNRVIVVPHSQGNFVTNDAFVNITALRQQATKVVAVATPAGSVPRSGPYIKLERDWLSRLHIGLAGNVSQTANCTVDPLLNHNFVGCYLSFSATARSQILSEINSGLTITPPNAIIGLGLITATLRWSSAADVDLHVFEPNGAHVYYGRFSGPSGTLDRDDTVGTGPENYVVCQRPVEVGSYRIGVNYFRGTAAETATINVKAGNLTRAFSTSLTTAVGSAGDNSPIPVGAVVVTKDQNNVLHYQIQ